MNRYLRKQIIIILVFLLIVITISASVYFLFRPKPEATCFDGIKNQGEEKIDCGGPCLPCEKQREPLEVVYQEALFTSENNFDLIAEINNPNNDWGAKSVGYNLNVYNEQDENIFSKQGFFYILPQESKYIVEPKIYLEEKPQKIEFEIISTSWQKLSGFRDLALRIRDKKIQTGEGIQARVSAVVTNSTNYDLNRIELVGIIFNANKKILAVGRTEMTTLLRNENRYFEINWPHSIGEENVFFEIKTYTDVFSPENFIDVQGRGVSR